MVSRLLDAGRDFGAQRPFIMPLIVAAEEQAPWVRSPAGQRMAELNARRKALAVMYDPVGPNDPCVVEASTRGVSLRLQTTLDRTLLVGTTF